MRRARRRREETDAQLAAVVDEHRAMIRRREVERSLGQALEQAETEAQVIRAVRDALVALDPRRPYELHLVDRVEPVMDLVFATGETNPHAPTRTSPWNAVAARTGRTQVFPSTRTPDLCPHLATRIVEHCSAVSVPLLAMGRLVGLLQVTGPLGSPPPARLIETYETIARTTAAYLATVRAFGTAGSPGATDAARAAANPHAETARRTEAERLADRLPPAPDICEITGLPGLDQATDSASRLIARQVPLAVIAIEIDAFDAYVDRYGRAAADLALRVVTDRGLRAVGGDGLLFGVNDCKFLALVPRASAELALVLAGELRDGIARACAGGGNAPFTVCFGIVESRVGTTTTQLLGGAAASLRTAQARSHDRAVVGVEI